jgi:hypothetical protein
MSFSFVTVGQLMAQCEANPDKSISSSTLHYFMYIEKSEKLCVHMCAVESRLLYKFWLSIKEC